MSDLLPNDLPHPAAADPDLDVGESDTVPPPAVPVARGRGVPRPLPRPGLDPATALAENAGVMLGTARRVSICEDDAHDAVQAAAERFLRNAHRVEPETVTGWLVTVTRNEALRVRERRVRTGPIEDDDRRLVHAGDGPEDLVAREEEIDLAREALGRLKPHERLALWMQAEGRSYDEIAEELSWTRTKVNRNITEGRARLRRTLSGIATGEGCGSAGPRIDRLAGGEASAEDLRELRPHLRRCAACRGRLRRARGGRWGVLPPVLLAWFGGAGRGGAPSTPPVRSRVTELVADRLASVLPATQGAVTEAGLTLATGLAAAALGAGVIAGGGAGDGSRDRTEERSPAGASVPARAASAAVPRVAVSPVASGRATLGSTLATWSSAAERAAARSAAARRARARRRTLERRRAARLAATRAPAPAPSVPATPGTVSSSAAPPATSSPAAPVASPPPAAPAGGGGASSGGGTTSGSGGTSGGGSAAGEFGFE